MLSPARNWLPSIASFLSCDSHTPQIRPGRLMTASQLLLVQTIQAGERTTSYDEAPPPRWFADTLLDVAKEKILTTLSWLERWKVSPPGRARLCWNYLPMHSSVGLSLNINTAGSFRRITFSRQDWTMVNMSYHQFLLKYPHSSSRQSRRRANKRKRVSGDSSVALAVSWSMFFSVSGE